MREILFRGKTKGGEWYFGFFIKRRGIANIFKNGMLYEVESETVGQFTGITDKNGVKIFEGDIVQRGVITFSRGKFQGTYYDGSGDLAEDWEDDLYQERNIEVLGNIYENPELLQDAV